MVLLPKRLCLCVVLNQIIRAARLVTEEVHAAQDSRIAIPSSVDLGESSSVIATSKPIRPGAQQKLTGKDYGSIPDGLPERKAERKRMEKERAESDKQIQLLDPKLDEESITIKSELEQLHYILRTPTTDRVYWLKGLDTPVNFLLPKSTPERRAAKIFKILKKLIPLDRLNSLLKSQTKNISADPPHIPHGQHLPTTYSASLVPSQDGSLVLPIGQGIPLGKLPIHSGTRRILHGDVLSLIKDKIIDESILTWNSLQKKLIDFSKESPDDTKVDFQLDFLKSLFQLGDQIVSYRLLPSEFINSIELFKPKTLPQMLKFHIDLMFLKHGPNFFAAQDSLVPQLEFLTNGLAVKHFHRSIKALSAEDQEHVVYLALSTTLHHIIECFPDSQLTRSFRTIAEGFRKPEFLEQARSLSLALLDEPEIQHHVTGNYVLLVDTMDTLFSCFRFRIPTTMLVQSRIEFQMIYYILEFIDEYYKPILVRLLGIWGSYQLLAKQLKFMRSYLKCFRNRDQYPSYMYKNLDMSFVTVFDAQLQPWIQERLIDAFNNKNWLEIRGTVPHKKFNTWMSQVKSKHKYSLFS
ncbi:hypothetical protein PGTUg99_034525 [Puccinia graminis f. sp. tritici]|uniref:Uncharacterized protein n=1 Tax=Puccinia graminis f. sp. tritici TaxID=56615 RepID=A0A5B0SEG5_PUCGR|nr:hypothetical protein PGTUg99_034525 [Puccinia graminis f. sp. tritici]